MQSRTQHLGASLRRAPFVWFAVTILTFLVMDSVLVGVVDDQSSPNTPVAIVAAFSAAYAVGFWIVLPRVLRKQSDRGGADEQSAVLSWTLAMAPYLFSYAAILATGEAWTLVVGWLTSLVLLVLSVRRIRSRPDRDALPVVDSR